MKARVWIPHEGGISRYGEDCPTFNVFCQPRRFIRCKGSAGRVYLTSFPIMPIQAIEGFPILLSNAKAVE